jgi:L-lactate dehydrogenase
VKVGVIGVGAVGAATVLSLIERGGMCREIVLVDRTPERANGVATDMRYATPLSPTVEVRAGDYDALADSALVIITAGVNERAGGATDRSDPQGRMRLLDTNAKVYAEIVPKVVAAAPRAVLMVVTDPPDPLADLTRRLRQQAAGIVACDLLHHRHGVACEGCLCGSTAPESLPTRTARGSLSKPATCC